MAHKEFGERLLERVRRTSILWPGRAVPRLEGRQMVMCWRRRKKAVLQGGETGSKTQDGAAEESVSKTCSSVINKR